VLGERCRTDVLAAHVGLGLGEGPWPAARLRRLEGQGADRNLPPTELAPSHDIAAQGPQPGQRPQDSHPVEGAGMVQMAAECVPHANHLVICGVGVGEVLALGQ
jgi:hypothetical protein